LLELRITGRNGRESRGVAIDASALERFSLHQPSRRDDIERLRAEVCAREVEIQSLKNRPAAAVSATPRPIVPTERILDVLPVDDVELVPSDAPVTVPAIAPEEPTPTPPRRTWGELLASFMEQRHILWGELVGGFLIVGCSVALVLSLWQSLQRIPLFPFLILAALTSALFGVGRYTLRRWKLEATSRGLLVIALLLVP